MSSATGKEPPELISVDQIQDLSSSHYAELAAQWTKYIGRPPQKSASRQLLERAIAYSLQERLHGGLTKTTLRTLLKHAGSTDGKASNRASTGGEDVGGEKCPLKTSPAIAQRKKQGMARLRPGTRLIRQWQGKSHSVEVRDDGFQWNGKVFGSLSAVASAITGARWSGPRFFNP